MRTKIFSILAIIIGLMALGYAFFNQMQIAKIKKYGILAQAEPVGEITRERSVRRYGASISYHVKFRFLTQSGQEVSVSKELSANAIDKIRNGQPIWIRYLEKDPRETAKIAGDEGEGAYVFWLGGIFILGYGIYGIRRSRNL
jgi:hypothetical protein